MTIASELDEAVEPVPARRPNVSCGVCGDTWNSLKWEHCTRCHLTFTTTAAGDYHLTGEHGVDRRCRTRSEIEDSGKWTSRITITDTICTVLVKGLPNPRFAE